jgi:hypothetical protein
MSPAEVNNYFIFNNLMSLKRIATATFEVAVRGITAGRRSSAGEVPGKNLVRCIGVTGKSHMGQS